MTIDIRPLTSDDADSYWHLRLEALEREPRAFGTSADEHRRTTVADAAARLAGPDTVVMGAFADGRLRGMAGLARETRRKTRHKAGVWGVYVAPELRGRGAGRRLLTALIAYARGMSGVERLTIAVTTTQPAAQALYRDLGFERWGTEEAALKLGDEYLTEEYLSVKL